MRNTRREKNQLEKKLRAHETMLKKQIERNMSVPELPQLARQLHEMQIHYRTYLDIETDLNQACFQLNHLSVKETEQDLFDSISSIYVHLSNQARNRLPANKLAGYERAKARMDDVSEMYSESFRSSDEYASQEEDVQEIMKRFISEKGISLPSAPLDPIISSIARRNEKGAEKREILVSEGFGAISADGRKIGNSLNAHSTSHTHVSGVEGSVEDLEERFRKLNDLPKPPSN
jgi:hypothetical protein